MARKGARWKSDRFWRRNRSEKKMEPKLALSWNLFHIATVRKLYSAGSCSTWNIPRLAGSSSISPGRCRQPCPQTPPPALLWLIIHAATEEAIDGASLFNHGRYERERRDSGRRDWRHYPPPRQGECVSKCLLQDIAAALEALRSGPVRVVILRAPAGARVFSAGHDVHELPTNGRDPLTYNDPLRQVVRESSFAPCPSSPSSKDPSGAVRASWSWAAT